MTVSSEMYLKWLLLLSCNGGQMRCCLLCKEWMGSLPFSCMGWGWKSSDMKRDTRNGSVLTALLFPFSGMTMSMDTATVLWT